MNSMLNALATLFGLALMLKCAAGETPALKLVMFGDSTTACVAAPEGEKMPQQLEKMLNAEFKGRINWTVVNKGVGSSTAAGGGAAQAATLDAEKPQFVSIAYGLNDMGVKDQKVFETNMAALIEKIMKHPCHPTLFVFTTNPIYKHFYHKDPFFAEKGGADWYLDNVVNFTTRSLAAENKLPFCDVYRAFVHEADYGKLLTDGVHPSPQGYKVVATAITKSLSAYVKANLVKDQAVLKVEQIARAQIEKARKLAASASPAERKQASDILTQVAETCPYLADTYLLLAKIAIADKPQH